MKKAETGFSKKNLKCKCICLIKFIGYSRRSDKLNKLAIKIVEDIEVMLIVKTQAEYG